MSAKFGGKVIMKTTSAGRELPALLHVLPVLVVAFIQGTVGVVCTWRLRRRL